MRLNFRPGFSRRALVLLASALVVTSAAAQAATTKASATMKSATLLALACPSAEVCFGIDGQHSFARSNDFGATWTVRSLSLPIVSELSIACPSTQDCIVSVESGHLGSSPQPPRFAMTRDGGRSWQLSRPPAAIAEIGQVACSSISRCVALAMTSSSHGVVLRTGDGGRSWSESGPSFLYGSGALTCQLTTCLRATGGYGPKGPVPEVVSRSTDAGAHFGATVVLPHAELIAQMTCVKARCLAVGGSLSQGEPGPGDGLAFVSADGGSTWRRSILPRTVAVLDSVGCATTLHCWATGTSAASSNPASSRAVLLRSYDGGQSFVVELEGRAAPSNAVGCNRRCLAAGLGKVTELGS
jgi:photosystem II stability/assembly factor-like uncharacterized protein